MADGRATKKASSDDNIPISLGKPSLRRRLEAYYSLVNPDSIQDPVKWRNTLDQIYDKYGGSYDGERKLATKLAKKYGSTVRLLLAESVVVVKNKAATTPQQQQQQQQQQVQDETWFQLQPQQRNSGIIQFTSERFDPLATLQASEERVLQENNLVQQQGTPLPRLNHIDQFRSHLPKNDPLYRDLAVPKQQRRAIQEEASNNKPKTKKLGPFASLAENHQQGPWSLLYKMFEKRQRIRVVIRYVNGIRGTMTGYLVAYDKHFNMILRDVDEVYCPRPNTNTQQEGMNDNNHDDKGETTQPKTNERTTSSNLELEMSRRINALLPPSTSRPAASDHHGRSNQQTSSWSLRQRHMKQILIRGDNVVSVYRAESERSAWPKTSKSPTKSVHGRKARIVAPEQRVGTPGSLIYGQQQQQQQQKQRKRPPPSHTSKYDYRSSKR